MPKHIGIAAVSPEGSAFCYREIFRYAGQILGDSGHPVVSMHGEPFEKYLAAVLRDDWHAVGELLLKSSRVLAAAGAEFCITPDNVMQHGVHLAEHQSPIPWMTMTDLVAESVVSDGRKTVGLVGTRMVMFGSTYQTLLGIKGVKVIVPKGEDAEEMDGIIFRELVHGEVNPKSQRSMVEIIARLRDAGAEGVVLGFSESSLLVNAGNSPLPVYDPVGLLAHSAVMHAVGQGGLVRQR